MGYRVELYIYDLSAGMARQLAPMLGLGGAFGLNFDLEGIWHTAIVVHNTEWFFGGTGIERCPPGGTMMGQPLRIEHLGETNLDLDSFKDYLHGLGQDLFRGDRYDLFKHNCNNFSNHVAQFLCGRNIPQYILDLPEKFLNSPIASLVRPFIEQATPHGQAMDNGANGFGFESSPSGSRDFRPAEQASSRNSQHSPKKEDVKEYIGFTAELTTDRVLPKIRELSSKPDKVGHSLSEDQLAKIGYLLDKVAMLDVKVWNEVLKPVLLNWPLEDLFPLLDVIRSCCVRSQLPAVVMADIVKMSNDRRLVDSESPESVVRLTLRLLANFFLFESGRAFLRERSEQLINSVQSLIEKMPSGRDHVELAATAIMFNFALTTKSKPDADLSILLTSSLSTIFIEKIKNFEALHRVIATLTSLIDGDVETRDFAAAVDLKQALINLPKLDKKVENAANDCIRLLG